MVTIKTTCVSEITFVYLDVFFRLRQMHDMAARDPKEDDFFCTDSFFINTFYPFGLQGINLGLNYISWIPVFWDLLVQIHAEVDLIHSQKRALWFYIHTTESIVASYLRRYQILINSRYLKSFLSSWQIVFLTLHVIP